MATIRERGSNQWQAQIRKKGYPLRSKTFPSRAEAEAWTREVEGRMNAPTDSRAEAERTTLGEALERFLREVTPTKKGVSREARRIRRWQAHPLAQRSLASIRRSDIAAFRDERIAQRQGASTIISDLSVISRLYVVAIKEWGMESLINPVSNTRMPKRPSGRDRRLEGDEERRLLAVAQSPTREVFTLAVETAMRAGELCSLRWSNIDLDARIAILPDTKNGERRKVPLSSRAVASLRALRGTSEGDDVLPLCTRILSKKFQLLCQEVGIEGLRFHDLRHEATSRLFERGLNIMEVAAITGHKNLEMLKRYTHLRAEELVLKLR